MNPGKKCHSCSFYSPMEPYEGPQRTGFGECRHRSPRPHPDPLSSTGRWPRMYGDEWCGDWEPPYGMSIDEAVTMSSKEWKPLNHQPV